MPVCQICGRRTPTVATVPDIGQVCPARSEGDCLEQARERADRKWRSDAEADPDHGAEA